MISEPIHQHHKYQGFLLSLVVPVYFEEEVIKQFIAICVGELNKLKVNYELLFIDDGSRDLTVPFIKEAIQENDRIRLIELSYNHGKEAALTAGISYSAGELLLYMDPDLQDPPDEIVLFLDKIMEGYDLVWGIRKEKKDSLLNQLYSKAFWLTLDSLTGLNLPRPLAVMRMFNRKFANKFLEYREANRFIEGMFMNVGMKQAQVLISQRDRFAGKSKFNLKRKFALALRAIFDYSEIPLAIATKFGAFLMLFSIVVGLGVIFTRLFVASFYVGWPSLFVSLLFGFGLQIFFFGLLGRYVGNIYREVKRRPLFSVRELTNCRSI